jgi:hypothetical protein
MYENKSVFSKKNDKIYTHFLRFKGFKALGRKGIKLTIAQSFYRL